MEPAPRGARSKEVSGEADGVTLAECLADGRVPVPDRMSFPKWQQWRKAEGKRPTKRKDGVGLSTAEEVALWRATMEALYPEHRILIRINICFSILILTQNQYFFIENINIQNQCFL